MKPLTIIGEREGGILETEINPSKFEVRCSIHTYIHTYIHGNVDHETQKTQRQRANKEVQEDTHPRIEDPRHNCRLLMPPV